MLFWIAVITYFAVNAIGEGLGWDSSLADGAAMLAALVVTGISWIVRSIIRSKYGDDVFNRDDDW